MTTHLTPRQLAQAFGVSEASIKRWCDRGVIRAERTEGGHRRIERSEAVAYARRSGRQMVHPEILGLPPIAGPTELSLRRSVAELTDALATGDRERFRAERLYRDRISVVETAHVKLAGARLFRAVRYPADD